jgi:phosphoribosylamine---glycine ligase
MRVLVIGGGGREHALCWAISRSPRVDEIVCMPGNAGIARLARCVPGDPEDSGAVANLAVDMGADLTIVGPEAPLVAGIADEFRRRGLRVVGHNRAAAMLEGSKVFAKQFMARHDIPTARFTICDSAEAARIAVRAGTLGLPVVVKADGLAAGKGVRIAATVEEADEAIQAFMVDRELGEAGSRVVLEEALVGREASLIYLTDGVRIVPLPPAQDYKRIGDGDSGPNTGGMGTFSVDDLVDAETARRVYDAIVEPTVRLMREEGAALSGVLFVGVMLTADGPKTLEYNLRFGDPETQSILARLDSDVVDAFEGIADGSLEGREMQWSADAALCLVLASRGYPGPIDKGKVIVGLDDAERVDGVAVFHAGTTTAPDGSIVTAGGRVLGVTARAGSLDEARGRAYEAAARIRFDGKTFRSDIGTL